MINWIGESWVEVQAIKNTASHNRLRQVMFENRIPCRKFSHSRAVRSYEHRREQPCSGLVALNVGTEHNWGIRN
ncbi:hypothetical protein BC936DRAFT_144878 [Jimgerdemannia flammicorona]|uniref:Uncharacterized protein n=1 Tax=Jimgerdemannia flammicorona TaxID=994334 RepID=A0A433DLX9_9FUNG|nr:hypothetical protein BC936DRAFT_144878 [Jimgerdemannia flammicorona]